VYNDELTASKWALNSAVECHLHTVEVIGSNPIAPTIKSFPMWRIPRPLAQRSHVVRLRPSSLTLASAARLSETAQRSDADSPCPWSIQDEFMPGLRLNRLSVPTR
jgi:hypothetical protein